MSTIGRSGPWLDVDQVRRRLRRAAAGNQAGWAKQHGISAAYVSDVLSNRRSPGDKITKALGLEKALLWRLAAARTKPEKR